MVIPVRAYSMWWGFGGGFTSKNN